MKHHLNKYQLYIFLAIFIIDAGKFAVAGGREAFDFDKIFNEEQSLKDDELDDLRGGFVTRNGMTIDFSFSTNTLVDGELINQVVLSTVEQSVSSTTPLRNIIQIGDNNSAFSSAANVSSLPNVMSIVQNSLNDLTIQQVNLLDLHVQNFDNFKQQNFVSELSFQSSIGLAP